MLDIDEINHIPQPARDVCPSRQYVHENPPDPDSSLSSLVSLNRLLRSSDQDRQLRHPFILKRSVSEC